MGRDWDPTVWLLRGTLFFLWVSVSMLLGEFCGRCIGSAAETRTSWLQRVLLWLHHALALAPAFWVVAAAALIARAVVDGGGWPSWANRDYFSGDTPPNIAVQALGPYYEIAVFALAAMLLSVFAFPTLHGAARGRIVGRRGSWFATWLVTWLFGIATLVYDGRYAIAYWFE